MLTGVHGLRHHEQDVTKAYMDQALRSAGALTFAVLMVLAICLAVVFLTVGSSGG